jgi:predicted permease
VRRPEHDLAREIDTHLALMQEAYESRGMTPDAARRAARLALGGVEQTKERHREARSFIWIEDARQDVAHGLRLLRRSPLFTFTAATSLAIGIGVNTAIFTVANGLLFRPPSGIVDPHELIDIGAARGDGGLNPLPYPTYLEVARRSTLLAGVFAQDMSPQVMSFVPPETGVAERVLGQYVTTNFFSVLGSQPSRGRIFAADDDAVAVLDYGYWTRRFNSDDGVIGRMFRLNGRTITVVGVAAAGFQGTGIQIRDIWLAIGPGARRTSTVTAGARVRGGISTATARAEVTTIGDAINHEQQKTSQATRLNALAFSRAGGNRNLVFGFAGVLMVLVSIVLAVACANVAGIVLARSTARAREISIRTALGAWRGRLLRQLLTETLVLYLLGGFLGIALARALLSLTASLPALPTPISVPLVFDVRVLTFALLMSLCAAVASGVLPAFKSSKSDPATVMKEGARSSPARSRLRSIFVVGQVALSILLVVVGALFVRVLQYAGATSPGFDSRGVEIASLDLSMAIDSPTEKAAFWRRLMERVRQLPTVEAASLARVPPGGFEGIGLGGIAAADAPAGSDVLSPGWNIIDGSYFAALGIPLVAGRDFIDRDQAGSPPVVIVSQAIARRLWPGQNAVGKLVVLSIFNARTGRMERRSADVVGVAGDIRSSSLVDGLAEPYVYLPRAQSAETGMTTAMSIVARRRGGSSLELALIAVVRDLDPNLVVVNTQLLDDAVALGLAPQRVLVAVAGTMGLVGLLLASMGIYGVTAYSVALRRREFGIRLALGAARARVIGMVLRDGMVLVSVGAIIGLALAAGAGQVLSLFFYGLPSIHIPTLVAAFAFFVIVGAAACVVPAGQAVRVDWQRALGEQ